MKPNDLHISQNSMLKTNLSNRIYGLDILRAVAILCVLIGHSLEFMPSSLELFLYHFTVHGVTFFFVLSGFLIGGILIKMLNTEKFTVKSLFKFWTNRWMRTIPPYYFVLTLLLIYVFTFEISFRPGHLEYWQIGRYYLFLQNFKMQHYGFYIESWSLAVEEWFYILTPISLFILIRLLRFNIKTALLVSSFVVIVGVIIIRAYKFSHGMLWENQVVTRMDSLMFGVIGAYAIRYHNGFWEKNKYPLFFIGISFLIIKLLGGLFLPSSITKSWYVDCYSSVIEMTIVPFFILLLMPFLHSVKHGKGIIYKLLTYISLISYSLYLLHHTLIKYAVIGGLEQHFELSTFTKFVLYWTLGLSASTLMYLYLEKPCMDIRNKIKFLRK